MSATQSESAGFYRLNWLQRIGFGAGDLAQNLIYNTIATYLLFFYTQVFGLGAGVAATMFLIVRIIDAVWAPLVGTFIDKHTTPWGRYRGWLILAGIPTAGFGVLVFWDGFSGSLLYAYVMYIGLELAYTLLNVPYGALNASLTRDNHEISVLTTTRMFMANIGGLVVAFGVPVIVQAIAPNNEWGVPAAAGAWLATMSILIVIGFLILIFCFTQTKERVVMDASLQDEVKITDLAVEFRRNRPLRTLAFFFVTAFAMMAVGNSGAAFYMTEVVKREDLAGLFNALGVLPAFVFLPLVPMIRRRIGKRPLFIAFLLIGIIGLAMLYFIPNPHENVAWVMVAQVVRSIGVIVATGYMWALVPEVISYGEWKTGRRISGIVNALTGIFFRAGFALGGVVPGIVLALTGFVTDSAQQSARTQQGILWLVSVIPAILLILAVFIISRYDLSDAQLVQINREIEQRQREGSAEGTDRTPALPNSSLADPAFTGSLDITQRAPGNEKTPGT
ncbi:MFS transporter [Gryllotalpicola protaetiae]|uniref:MFS transporter n=1 Tax=Gryllotalpicola protaetiae TaxID=2419771 RepID=A0A387BLS6_9MICO|nr:MFS transporter [Gryllotalpicola protaetiae]AYG05115.1 MFS transporter [Gryllotalpicola protaetiae]